MVEVKLGSGLFLILTPAAALCFQPLKLFLCVSLTLWAAGSSGWRTASLLELLITV